ncbi:MAG TPA: rhomboid family intramembrane serine protease [Bacteroidia bacterium]|nr:rhomboid family intramembrane serine protease [Bacteroidia bacterium]
MRWIDELRMNFIKAEGLFRLMAINIGLFLLLSLLKLFFFLAGIHGFSADIVADWLAFPAAIVAFLKQPWSIVTYMFVHINFFHILFNMLILYWAGKLFCDMLGSRRVVIVYLMGGIWGGLLYMILFNVLPAFTGTVEMSRLIGASAGVIAVLCAIATLVPDYTIHLLFFGPVRLKYIALFLVVLYLISIPDGNAGGNISHLGGALYGYLYTRSLKNGGSPGLLPEKIFAWFTNRGKGNLRMVHKKSSRQTPDRHSRQEVIDAILDKINQSGYDSLSTEEKDILFKASGNSESES